MSKLKIQFSDAVDVIKLIIALLPLIKEILEIIDSWTPSTESDN